MQSRLRNRVFAGFVAVAALSALLTARTPADPVDVAPFTRAAPESAGMSPARLREATEAVRRWIEDGRIVGAVMLVIRNDRVVLFDAAGMADRERQEAMTVGAICRMRSMTKPLIGTAVLMLVEEGRIALKDPVAKYLPSFRGPRSRDITVHQLLTHTSGLTGAIYDTLKGTEYKTLREAVDAVGAKGPEHDPGTKYEYSDPGTSTLGALIAEVSGMPAEKFLEARILGPLGMKDSICHFTTDDPRAPRVAATYHGGPGKWEKYWDRTQPQLLPFFRASGGLYASALDYVRFMSMMLKGGEFGGRRLLSRASVTLATSPHADAVFTPEERAKRSTFYGLHWIAHTDKYTRVEPPLVPGMFSHGGSDGTLAWADPSSGVIGVYLTQSRGNGSGGEFMRLVQAAVER
jgi:CubicO group peptidase (beta-lactamase class C family)